MLLYFLLNLIIYYKNYNYNYDNDYLIVNRKGSTSTLSDLKIASNQAFMVEMLDSAPSNSALNFKNSMRNKSFCNCSFFKNVPDEKNRLLYFTLLLELERNRCHSRRRISSRILFVNRCYNDRYRCLSFAPQ